MIISTCHVCTRSISVDNKPGLPERSDYVLCYPCWLAT